MIDTNKAPTADLVRQMRTNAGLSQEAAAQLVYLTRRAWQRYEEGNPIKLAVWELFLFKTGQAWIKPAVVNRKPRRAHPGRVQNLRPAKAS